MIERFSVLPCKHGHQNSDACGHGTGSTDLNAHMGRRGAYEPEGRTDVDALMPALKRAAPFLRSELAHGLRLRSVPRLSFQADTSLDYAMEVDALLRSPEVARDLGEE